MIDKLHWRNIFIPNPSQWGWEAPTCVEIHGVRRLHGLRVKDQTGGDRLSLRPHLRGYLNPLSRFDNATRPLLGLVCREQKRKDDVAWLILGM
jgi:hypothetical protein